MRNWMILILLLAGCGNGNPIHVVAFGDSITEGWNVNRGYVSRVAQGLGMASVSNYAVSGSRIAQEGQMGQIKRAIIHPSDFVLFLSGYNDMRAYGLPGVQDYQMNLITALTLLNRSGAQIYLGSCLKLNAIGYGRYTYIPGTDERTVIAYRDAARSAMDSIRSSRIHWVDTTDLFIPVDADLQTDGLHPNDLGAQMIAELFLSKMGAE